MSLYDTGVRQLVDDYLVEESRKVRDYGDYWSASSAGYCMRKVIFERLGVPKIEQEGDARKQRVFTAGHIFHDWIQQLTEETGVSIAQEMELESDEIMVRGHFDDIIRANDKYILYDYKTVNSRSFMWAKKNGNAMSHFHRLQLGTYLYLFNSNEWRKWGDYSKINDDYPVELGPLTEARILKIEKENLMMMEQKLEWTPDLERDVVQYWTTLNGYWKSQTMPKCTCADYESGFMAKEAYNGYFYDGEPCSLVYYKKWKESQKV